MFNISFRLTKSKMAAGILLVLGVLSVLLFTGADKGIAGDSDSARRSYILSLGYTPADEPSEASEVVIPTEFSDVYRQYNELQLQAGFDLMDYRGEGAVRYSYFLCDYDRQQYVVANLLVCNGKIIGGDISSRRLDGFMLPLVSKGDGQTG